MPPIDRVGLAIIAPGCPEVAFDRAEHHGWLDSGLVRVTMGPSSAAFTVGIPCLPIVRHPSVSLRAFQERHLAIAWFQTARMGFGPCASAVLVPHHARRRVGDATPAGPLPAPGALLLIVPIPIISRVMNVVPVKYVIALGGLALGPAPFFSMNLVPGPTFLLPAFCRAGQGGALAFLFASAGTDVFLLTGCAAFLFSPTVLMLSGARSKPSGGEH